jgi:predicted phage tail protein
MSQKAIIGATGSGGGGDSRAPIEHDNTLFSKAVAGVVDLVSEGEIFGAVDRDNIAKSIYFDEVVVQNEDGSFNFEGVTIQERLGTPEQTVVDGFQELESSVSINQEITDISSPTFTITDTNIDAIRVIVRLPSLLTQNTDNGDLLEHTVGFKIEVSEGDSGGTFTELLDLTITGKANSPYQKAYRISLKPYSGADYPLVFRVTRTTQESEETTTQDQIFLDSYIELQEQRLRYPDSAYFAITVDSELFGGRIPRRSYEIKGIKIQIPSNYDPDTRVYSGIWDGTFSEGYCNNPAWILYDILTNSRYGLGDDISSTQVDKAALYSIGQYCDEMVDDGSGGEEPRFTLNAAITQRKEAFTVVNAITSAFRGMAFWSTGGVSFSIDQPKEASKLVGPANVIGGEFTYSGVALKARHSAVLVTWNDPADFYKQQIEVVEDTDLIYRFGWRQIELVAFGTTSRAQAIRMGKWLLDTEANETETVTYRTGFDHADTTPGQIIKISDPCRVGARLSGRILATDLERLTPAIPTDLFAKDATFTSVSTYVDTGVDGDNAAIFKCTIRVPSGIAPIGVIFEAGSSADSGAYVGFDGNSDLIFRAGDGSTSPAVTTSARIVIPYADIPKDQNIDLLWDYRVSPGRIRVWINNRFVAEQGTSAGADFLGSAWAGLNGGGYGTVNSSTVDGEAGAFTQDVEDSGVIIKSSLSYWRDDQCYTPTYGQTLKESFSDGDTVTSSTTTTAGSMDVNTPALFSCAIQMPAEGTTPEGVIFELGEGLASNEAFYLGFDGNGDLVVHAGAGGSAPDILEAARIVVPSVEWVANKTYNLTVNVVPADGRVVLWINHVLREYAQTNDLTAFQNGQWADSNTGGYGITAVDTLIDLTGSYKSPFNGTIVSSLDYFRDVNLVLTSRTWSAGTLTLDQDHSTEPGDRLLVITEENIPTEVGLLAGTTGATVTLLDYPEKDIPLNAMFIIRGAVRPEEWRVLNNREADTHQYEITALKYDSTKFDRIEKGIHIVQDPVSLVPTGPLAPPTNLVVTESLYQTNGNVHTRINVSWTATSVDARVMLYRVDAKKPGGNWISYGATPIPNMTIEPAQEGIWEFQVTSLSEASMTGHISSRTAVLTQEIFGKTLPPGDVTNLTAVRGFTSVTLSWDPVIDLDLTGYEIRLDTDWDAGTVIVQNLNATSFRIEVDTTDAVTYSIKAIDSLGNYSVNSTAITTSIQVLNAVTSLISYQRLHNIRVRWDAVVGVANVQYEVRHRGASWATSQLLGRVATPYMEAPFSVDAETTATIRIKPYVILSTGLPHYGPETTISHSQFPIVGGFRVKSQAEHPAWSEAGTTIAERFLLNGKLVDETFASGAIIHPRVKYTAGKSPARVSFLRDAAFHCKLTVASGANPLGIIMACGISNAGALVMFDGNGALIIRAGNGSDGLFTLDDLTSVIHRWSLSETVGVAYQDTIGTNHLTDNGLVERALNGYTQAPLFDGSSTSFLSGTDITINTKSWTLAFTCSPEPGYDLGGKVFQLGTGATLTVEFVAGYLTATVNDGSPVSVTSTSLTSEGSGLLSYIITYDEPTKTLTMYYDDTSQDTAVAAGSLVDSAGTLRIGEDFLGWVYNVWWIERVITSDERNDLNVRIPAYFNLGRLAIPLASIPLDTEFDLVFDFHPGDFTGLNPGRVRAWINDDPYVGETPFGSCLGYPGKWSTSSGGRYEPTFGISHTPEDAEAGLWNVALNAQVTTGSDLSYWYMGSVLDPMEVNVSDELTLTSAASYGRYEFDFVFAGLRKGRLWVEYTVSSVADDVMLIDDAVGLIDDAIYPITLSFPDIEPYLSIFIQLDGAGDFVPFEEGSYEFTTAKFRVVMQRDPVDDTIPLLQDFTVYFHNDGDQTTLQAQTTNATQTTLTTNGEAAAATNIILLTDNNTLRFEGTLMAKTSNNLEHAKYFVEGIFERGVGAATVAEVTSKLTVLHEDVDAWDVEIAADVTNGGILIKVTGEAATTINWIADIYVREFA